MCGVTSNVMRVGWGVYLVGVGDDGGSAGAGAWAEKACAFSVGQEAEVWVFARAWPCSVVVRQPTLGSHNTRHLEMQHLVLLLFQARATLHPSKSNTPMALPICSGAGGGRGGRLPRPAPRPSPATPSSGRRPGQPRAAATRRPHHQPPPGLCWRPPRCAAWPAGGMGMGRDSLALGAGRPRSCSAAVACRCTYPAASGGFLMGHAALEHQGNGLHLAAYCTVPRCVPSFLQTVGPPTPPAPAACPHGSAPLRETASPTPPAPAGSTPSMRSTLPGGAKGVDAADCGEAAASAEKVRGVGRAYVVTWSGAHLWTGSVILQAGSPGFTAPWNLASRTPAPTVHRISGGLPGTGCSSTPPTG